MSTMNASGLAAYQQSMGLHLRDPKRHPRPAGLDARRTAIYSTLVMNNIEGCLATALPVCKAVLGARWPRLMRAFCRDARSHTPLYHELSGEFLTWLMAAAPTLRLPVWLVSLAHYEWAELAVEVMETKPVTTWASADLSHWPSAQAARANPALLALNYDWPVHRIGPDHRPRRPQATALVVYRNEHERVKFQLVNSPTLRLIALLTPSDDRAQALPTPQAACEQIAVEMGRPGDEGLIDAGLAQVLTLLRAQVLLPG